MPTTITFLGHSGVMVRRGPHTLLIDPFLTGNPAAVHTPAQLSPPHIALTHGHDDHIGDTAALAKASGATLYAAYEICEFFGEQGIKHLEPGNPGGEIQTAFGSIAFTKAFHSSSHKGRYMGQPCGLVIRLRGDNEKDLTLYHCGDTDLFADMGLIADIYKPDIAFIPIGDRFTMGPALATRAAELIRPRVAVPVHYNTWPPIEVDVGAFKPKGVEVRAMKPGENWTV